LISLTSTIVCLRLAFALALLFLVLVFAEVEDLADGGGRLRIHLDEIQADLLRAPERGFGRQHAEVRAVRVDDANLRHADPVVDANLGPAGVPAETASAAAYCHRE
jgi:hypothetical protein